MVKKLITGYSRTTSPQSNEYFSVLKGMGGKLKDQRTSGGSSHSREWTKLSDCGRLFHVNNTVYDLFLYLEVTIDEEFGLFFHSEASSCSY